MPTAKADRALLSRAEVIDTDLLVCQTFNSKRLQFTCSLAVSFGYENRRKSIFRDLVAKRTTVMWRIAESRKQASTQYIAVGAQKECVEEGEDDKEKRHRTLSDFGLF